MTKIDEVFRRLNEDWATVGELCKSVGWQAHTLRAAISVHARKHGITLERRRLNGITSYRVAEEKAEPLDAAGCSSTLEKVRCL